MDLTKIYSVNSTPSGGYRALQERGGQWPRNWRFTNVGVRPVKRVSIRTGMIIGTSIYY